MPYREPDGNDKGMSCVVPFNLLETEEYIRRKEAVQAERGARPGFVAGDHLLTIYKVQLHRGSIVAGNRLQVQTTVVKGPGGDPSPYAGRDFFEICALGHQPAAAMCFSILSACQPGKVHELLVACSGHFDMATLIGCQYWATVELKQDYARVVKRREV